MSRQVVFEGVQNLRQLKLPVRFCVLQNMSFSHLLCRNATDHVARVVHQFFTGKDKPTFAPITSFRPTLHEVARKNALRWILYCASWYFRW